MMASIDTAYPRRLFWICFAVATVDGFDTLVISFIAPAFAAEWQLTATQVGQVFGAGLVGAALGAVAAGWLADRVGRRNALLGSVLLFAVLTLLCAVAPNADALMLLRFLAGLGLGGAIPTITALTAETLPAERRTAAVTRMFLGFPIGAVVGGALCAAMIDSLGWRSAFWLGGLLGLLLIPLLLSQVRETLQAGHGDGRRRGSALDLFRQGRAVPALLLFAAAFLILLVSYFLINWTPSILVSAGLAERDAILGGMLLNLGGVVGAIALTTIVDRAPYALVGSVLLAGALLILTFGAHLGSLALAVPLVFATGMAVIGGQLALPALAAALFPKEVRATGVGVTMAVGRLGSILGPAIGGVLVDANLGSKILFLIVASPAAAAAVALLLCAWQAGRAGAEAPRFPGANA